MSVCVETSTTALIQPVVSPLSTSTNISEVVVSASTSQPAVGLTVETGASELKSDHQLTGKSIAKLMVASQQHVVPTSQVLQKVVSSPLITVLNSTGPLTVVKSICVTSVVSTAPQYTLVNTTAPLTVGNAVGKPPTITVLNCGPLTSPVTVVKTLTGQPVIDKSTADIVPAVIANNATGAPALIENRGHNVFVKNTSTCPAPDTTVVDSVLQSHKLLTAANFSTSNVLNNLPGTGKPPPANGQRNKLKILSNVQLTGATQSNNALVNKAQARYNVAPRPKLIGVNNMSMKLMQKAPNNVIKPAVNPSLKSPTEKSPKAIQPPPQKGPIKNLPPSTFLPKPQQGIKTLSPQQKNIPGQVQRTTSGLRTIPPQRPQKVPTKTNYIGKHAVQAQKVNKPPAHAKMKSLRSPPGNMYSYHQAPMHEKQLTFNQALTAQIIETLSNTSTPPPSTKYEWLPSRYDNAFHCPDKQVPETLKVEDKAKSGLDALSLICQAVLLDHNYNATLPPESPPRSTPPINTQAQVNGIPNVNIYSNMQAKRRIVPPPNNLPTPSHSSMVLGPTINSSLLSSHLVNQDDDAASDVSDGSDRKHDTEGEETDTAPEAEEVKNDDHYGDYVTRCICGFLHDDGYMVECDKCKVWQHVQCVVKNRQIPDEYLCDMCDPSKPVDRQKARLIQQQWIRERQLIEPKIRKEAKLKDTLRQKDHMSDSDSSDGERTIRNNNVTTKRTSGLRRKSESSKTTKKDLKEPLVKRQKRKEKKVMKRKPKPQVKPPPQSHSDDENQDTWSAHLPQLRQWIEKYEEAVTNHYSPELRARISSIRVNGAHVDSNITYDSTVCKCRIHTQPLTEIKYLVSTVQLAANTPIIELRGKYMLSTQHRNSGGSLTTRQHTQKPGPFLFFYRLHKDNTEVCVDTRTYGNSARFIRRSCKPNAELRHCIEKGVLHLYIVSISTVEKNCELTIKHESHDLAAIGTTQIACACGRPDECTVNKTTIKKNGESTEPTRKRRGRRTVSSSGPPPCLKSPVKEPAPSVTNEPVETTTSPPVPPISPTLPEPPKEEVKEEKLEIIETEEVKIEIKEEPVEEKVEEKVDVIPVVEPPEKEEPTPVKEEPCRTPSPPPVKVEKLEVKKEKPPKEERTKSPPLTPISTRRSSHQRSSDKEESGKETDVKPEPMPKSSKKLSREERKLEAILRAIEQMEKADQKKQEHQAKQAHRRESEPGPTPKEEEKVEPVAKVKRRRRRGRARTTSTNAQTRRSRLNSTDSYMTSGDENLMSPNEACSSKEAKAAGLLMALHNGDSEDKKSPQRDHDSNSNSAFSSPETPQLSSACLLVQAAVEPLESGFKFPKTKKGLMNEWLNKAPETAQSGNATSPSIFLPNLNQMVEDGAIPGSAGKTLSALAQVATFCDSPSQQRGGNAKKRWLRQAISEDHSSDGPPVGRPDSPTINDTVAPPKKRKLPRESLSTDNSPPSTPTSTGAAKSIDTPRTSQEGSVEIVYSGAEGDSPSHTLESDTELKERAAKMQQEYGKTVSLSSNEATPVEFASFMDPRLARDRGSFFANSEHLIGTVEKTLSIFGFKKSDCTPAKKKVKLSITEYRQRKKLTSDKTDDGESVENDQQTNEENNSSESFKAEELSSKPRSRSSSSSSSCSSLDNLSSDIVMKAPIFNSEPTELERQREISSLRLKKAFGLPIDEESCKTSVVDMTSILNCDMGPKLSSINPPPLSILSELSMSPTLRAPSTPEDRTYTPVPLPPNPVNETELSMPEQGVEAVSKTEEQMQVDELPVVMDETEEKPPSGGETQQERDANLFYTPDEDERLPVTELTEVDGVNYVPPFNNPVYPNSNFSSFTSAIDDDSRYQSRNPSPPPDLETTSFGPS